MSKQLAISAFFSVLAMAAFVASTAPQSEAGAAAFAPAPAYAAAAGLPGVSN